MKLYASDDMLGQPNIFTSMYNMRNNILYMFIRQPPGFCFMESQYGKPIKTFYITLGSAILFIYARFEISN